MFMGETAGIFMYKHSLTRRYLNVDRKGHTFEYVSENQSYRRVPEEAAIKWAFA
jgi:hypothetical protein